MTAVTVSPRARKSRIAGLVVLTLAAIIAAVSSRNCAGGWNDGSRLATVEALVDHHTLAIDKSIFVKVPAGVDAVAPLPYPVDDPGLLKDGTADKLFIHGHFYSDKSPVPAVLMAAVYRAWQWCTGLTARDRPDWFCYLLTLLSSGLAYVVAVWCIFRVGGMLALPFPLTLTLTASFALSTVALAYARHANNHILLLGVAAALMPCLLQLGKASRRGEVSGPLVYGIGTLAGLGYTIDLGAGPVLLACTVAVVVARCRRLTLLFVFALAALPWLALHHALNYAVGGSWKPANAFPEYFNWPGCPFNVQNMTGAWNHGSIGHFLTYAAALLVGKNGFLGHNLALFVALPAIVVLLWRRTAELPEVLFTGFWCGGTWLAYALTSTNYSGQCCSIRWFVPLLAPAYLVLGVFLREFPRYRGDVLVLSGWGAVLAGLAWLEGPWMKHMVPYYWPLQAAALASWVGYRVWRRRHVTSRAPLAATSAEQPAQAA